MDKELLELEAELKRLRPVAPSRELAAEISRSLSAPPRRNLAWAWFGVPLAAAAATVLLLRQPAAPVSPSTNPAPSTVVVPSAAAPAPVIGAAPAVAQASFKPVSSDKTLYAQSDDGVVTLADGTSALRYRASYVDTITWKNPQTRASLRWSVPRTEERVVPVTFQ